jgi:hypothetical protein
MAESTGGRASSVRRGRRRGRTLEHVQLTGLAGLRDLLARIQHNQALEHGVPQDSTLGDSYRLVLAERYTSALAPLPAPSNVWNIPQRCGSSCWMTTVSPHQHSSSPMPRN